MGASAWVAHATALLVIASTALLPATAEGALCCARGPLADSLEAAAFSMNAQAEVGALAVSLDRGDTLLAANESRRLIPGSNTKIFTTSVFLRRFGPAARFTTRLEARGKIDRGKGSAVRFKGDLVLRPAGVPDVTQILIPGSRGLLDSLAFLLRGAGLERFEGTLWVDGTLFADEPYGPGWAIEDVPYSYGATVGAVMANGNAATLVAEGGSKKVALTLEPPETPLALVPRARLGNAGGTGALDVQREQGSRSLRVVGVVPQGTILRKQVAVPDPDSTAGLWLLGAMRRAGIAVKDGRVRLVAHAPGPSGGGMGIGPEAESDDRSGRSDRDRDALGPPPASPSDTGWAAVRKDRTATVLSFLSPTAAEMVGVVHALSLNAESEALLRLLDPSPREKRRAAGLAEVRREAAAAGIDTLDLSLVDGSGLSPQNLATARSLVAWLVTQARDSALAIPFRQSLASPGENGTLRRRFAGLDPGAGLRAKTGTLTNVSSLSGYVNAASGERFAFALITNGNRGSTASAKQLEERVVGMLARRGSGSGGGVGASPPRIPR